MLVGEQGPASKMDMSIIARMAEFHQAERLLDIEQAHIDSAIYMGEAGLEFAERLAGLGATVAVPTTFNVSAVDEHHWREWVVPPAWAEQAQRQMAAYARFARHLRGHHRASAGCGPAPDRKPGRAASRRRILALPFSRGSSTTTAVLLEAVKAGTAPAAILMTAPDSFFALASIVADEMYRQPIPLIVLSNEDFGKLSDGQRVIVQAEG
jgi:hypothetical protein